jgi:hypothetical protein
MHACRNHGHQTRQGRHVGRRGDSGVPSAAPVCPLNSISLRAVSLAVTGLFVAGVQPLSSQPHPPSPAWTSPCHFRVLLEVSPQRQNPSHSPASVELDFGRILREHGAMRTFDEHTVAVVPLSRPAQRVPHRLDRLFGASGVTLNFVIPDSTYTRFAVYFDTTESGHAKPKRYPGLVGDGDRFCEGYGRRQIAASHFDCFVDFDGDGDLDLFKGGVEPFVYCFENVGNNHLVDRGRLASGGALFKLPCSRANRSWVTVAFSDVDGDGDQDFFPSFGDGPDAGRIVFYRNTTREHGGQLTFTRVGPLQTVSGVLLAGGAEAGGWFPSITFVKDWDGDGCGPDALVGSNHRCWLYRGLLNCSNLAQQSGAHLPVNLVAADVSPLHLNSKTVRADSRRLLRFTNSSRKSVSENLTPTQSPTGGEGARRAGEGEANMPRFAKAVAVQAAGRDIELINPRFEVADIDGDGDLDLLAGTQPGPVYWFQNVGSRTNPVFAAGQVIAWDGKYLIGDAHSGVKVADFDGDGLLDLVSGRFWERMDLNDPARPRVFGGFFKNVGRRAAPRFELRRFGGPFTEQFQPCDAIRQNSVRAVDWDNDGKLDLLAGDTDGFILFFRSEGNPQFPVFAPGKKLEAEGKVLSLSASGGHARFDVCDWSNDGLRDLIVADGSSSVTLSLNRGRKTRPVLAAGTRLQADGQPLQLGGRASVMACDWNNDGREDLLLADEKGYFVCLNIGSDARPELAAPKPVLFGGKKVSYVRPNLGAFVDWDGDGKRDLIGCHFENSVRFYRNVGSGAPDEEPRFTDPEGVVILQGESPQMISGADAVDWNSDGDLDLLTGQGHGGSGLRFFERDWIEDELRGTHPIVKILGVESKPSRRKPGAS